MQERPDVEKNIAVCYLFKDGDHRNRCVLTSHNLVITYRHTDHIFPLESLTGFGIERRRLLLAVVAGGIFIPLIFVGSMEFSINPVITVILIMAGAIIFYIGWNGAEVLVITASNQSFQCPFRSGSAGTRDFVSYVNSLKKGINLPELLFYLAVPENAPREKGIMDFIRSNPGQVTICSYGNLISFYMQKKLSGEQKLYSFDPLKSGISVRYLQTDEGAVINAAWPENIEPGELRFLGSIRDFHNSQTGRQH